MVDYVNSKLFCVYLLRYYDFDDSVMIEIQRMKLSMPRRKDLDDVCEKTGVNMKSCRLDMVKSVVSLLSFSQVAYNVNKLYFALQATV